MAGRDLGVGSNSSDRILELRILHTAAHSCMRQEGVLRLAVALLDCVVVLLDHRMFCLHRSRS